MTSKIYRMWIRPSKIKFAFFFAQIIRFPRHEHPFKNRFIGCGYGPAKLNLLPSFAQIIRFPRHEHPFKNRCIGCGYGPAKLNLLPFIRFPWPEYSFRIRLKGTAFVDEEKLFDHNLCTTVLSVFLYLFLQHPLIHSLMTYDTQNNNREIEYIYTTTTHLMTVVCEVTYQMLLRRGNRWRVTWGICCLLYTSPSPRDRQKSRMPSSA